MTQEIVQGGDLMLFLRGETLAFATSHKLSINVETVDNSNKDNGGGKWVSKTAKKISWNVTSENLYIETGDTKKKLKAFGDLFDIMTTRLPISITFTNKTNEDDDIPTEGGWTPNTTGTYTGSAIITSLEANAPDGDNATFSVTLEGVGPLTHTPVVKGPAKGDGGGL